LQDRSGELFSMATLADGSPRLVWLLTFVKGTVLAKVRPHAPELLSDLGRFLGEMDAALHSSRIRRAPELKWDSSRAAWIKNYVKHIVDAKDRALVEKFSRFTNWKWFRRCRGCAAASSTAMPMITTFS